MELRTGAESGRGDQFRTREGELWKITSVLTIAMEMVEADIGLIRGLKRGSFSTRQTLLYRKK
ncbi:unnamed protein product [Tuber melanosporum]|uniref:(Perigord truffle) hypothetical protein n=1 Tax=Tuber melanosporum (strain Mel28) TaxID=656061 RepID=D5GJU7_TUBMM|nr:uncharacterized protein GSTUM_00009204001 [Tuber melanosporum]CAZ84790.1 unnamed protein product [Tuber melanosporum]